MKMKQDDEMDGEMGGEIGRGDERAMKAARQPCNERNKLA
jgi:hypothetical protein